MLATILKWGWVFISTVLLGLFGWLFKKSADVYSKAETIELIDLKMQPLKQSIDNLKDSTDRSTETMERLCNSLNTIHTDVAIIKYQVSTMESKNAK